MQRANNWNRLGIWLAVISAGCGSSDRGSESEPASAAQPRSGVAEPKQGAGPAKLPSKPAPAATADAGASGSGFADRFAAPELEPAKARALIASLDGHWVNDTGLERKAWTIRDGRVTERVTRRGSKTDRGRARSFRIEARHRGRLEVIGDSERQSYYFLKTKKAFYASPAFGIFKMQSRRRFDVLDTAGNLIEYRDGQCAVRPPGGAAKPVRCLYSVSYYHKVLTVRYRLPGSGEHTVAVFHGEAGHLLHEQLLSCCKFARKR